MYSPKLRPPMSISNKAGDQDGTLLSTRRCLLTWAFVRLIVSLLWTGMVVLVTVVTIIHYNDEDNLNDKDRLLFEVPAIAVQMVEIGMLITFIVAGFKISSPLSPEWGVYEDLSDVVDVAGCAFLVPVLLQLASHEQY
ncbi:hypothetical protein HF086_005662 [Spodoptera exigua]|uniref:Uncharacterized protein n=1 Tax=Spodoptera exigua TaxID=7107 RepID=A0A922MYA4_SPOEX|nr:hypothetical protein HF086_005662 [Spodoptera exigua]